MSELGYIIGVYSTLIGAVAVMFTWHPRPPKYRIYKWPTKCLVFGAVFLALGWLTS